MATLGKKKKKKGKAAAADADAAGPEGAVAAGGSAEAAGDAGAGSESKSDPESKSAEGEYTYTDMLDRVFGLLRARNPDHATRKRQTLPPPDIVKVGTRKTMWSNFAQTAQLLHRAPEHVMDFVLAEFGTEGSLDGSNRLVLKGRFLNKQFESLVKKYIVEYVTCHMCRNPDTTLSRDSTTRLYFVKCEGCNSSRSVVPIKTGFHATNRGDRRKVKQAAI